MIKSTLIAPCGMNCGICIGHMREKNVCPGCNNRSGNIARACSRCRIFNCNERKKNNLRFCFSCNKYPCDRIKHLDKRYRTRYGMSMIENLDNIKLHGIRKFTALEKSRWECPNCKAKLCVHRDYCINCGERRTKTSYAI